MRARVVAIAVVALASFGARAQTVDDVAGQGAGSLDLERLRPALDDSGILDVEGGRIAGALGGALWLNGTLDPLTVNAAGRTVPIVAQRASAHLTTSLALTDSFALGLEIPGVLYQAGPQFVGGVAGKSPVASFGLDDVRVTPKLAVFTQAPRGVGGVGDALDLAVALHTTLPTSIPRHQYIGDGLPTVEPELDVSRAFGDKGALRVAGDVGFKLRAPSTFGNAVQGEELDLRAAVSYSLRDAGVPLELSASVNQSILAFPFDHAFDGHSDPAELLAGAAVDVGPVQIFAAAGTSLLDGAGAPLARVVGGVRYLGSRCVDDDKDGICAENDKCPGEAEDMDGHDDGDGCPDLDNDNDGVADAGDACPDVSGPVSTHGCPDADMDGVADKDDACFAVAGVAANKGCPYTREQDRDGDDIPNLLDKCPDQPEGKGGVDGCPHVEKPRAELQGNAIIPSERLALSSTQIDADSAALLNEVAAVLLAHPEIKKLRVNAHTEATAKKITALKLSQQQATLVKDYLVKRGVAPKRIAAVGLGGSLPVDPKMPKSEVNRRVDFVVERD